MSEKESIAVSVIIPVHNAAGYISDTLSTVLSQTLNDIEIIIEFTPGDIRYRGTMTVCGKRYTTHGVNLWNRYKYFVKILTSLYGDNSHKYGTKPISAND